MSDLRKALEQSKELLEWLTTQDIEGNIPVPKVNLQEVLCAVNKALAQPNQEEPFALAYRADGKDSYVLTTRVEDAQTICESGCVVTKLYTHPQNLGQLDVVRTQRVNTPSLAGQYLLKRKGHEWEVVSVTAGGKGWALSVNINTKSIPVADIDGEWGEISLCQRKVADDIR